MNTDIAVLNSRFGIENQVVFKTISEDFLVVEINNAHATASISLQGAHLMNWALKGGEPVIWMSQEASFKAGKSIRGGIPVCWPWFGGHSTDSSKPAHGFARTALWEVIQTEALKEGATLIAFRLIQNDANHDGWPYSSELEIHFIVGESLRVDLVTRNTGETVITIGDALHTYFSVSDVRNITINGLDGCPYLDKVDGSEQKKHQVGAVKFDQETDRIYLESTEDCVIDDPGLKRRIRISKLNSESTIVWNPWIEKSEQMGDMGQDGYLKMVCVESANAADDVVHLAPGDKHHLWVRYSVE